MLKEYIKKVSEHHDLTTEEMKTAMNIIMDGRASSEQVSAFLIAMKMKKESPAEIAAASRVMVSKATPLPTDVKGIVDIVGTGGDCLNTFNISTTSAFVAAAGGIRVAKHGNRSVSSKSGAADVLERLGAELALTAEQAETVLEDTGMCFLFAPAYHSSMKYAAPVRKEIGIRSIFNILGPLSNPAGASMQLLGVYSRDLVEPLAQVLANLGVTRGMVVCGGDGLDEATLTGPTHVCEIRYGKITAYDMTPEELGLTVCNLEELIGGTPEENAQITRNILSGSLKGPKRDVVVLNAAISLYLGIDDCTVRDCVKTAQDMIDSGAAMAKMEEFIQATKKAAGEVKAS